MKKPISPQTPAAVLEPLTFLRRVSLLLLVTAVMAGIFGMHVVSGSHGAHSASSVSPVIAAESALHVHDTVQLHRSPPADADKCSSGSCSCTQATTTNCIPSLQTGSLAAPPPAVAVAAIPVSWELHGFPRFWSYQPLGPTPVQLCISRT
ncbi:hypothetical protein [Paenarthrobacter nitroguajacolicus]|uniref:hypothetical protein n=1 Tax=Paenarthrobacter nitroguajacolicus TaxID=211146 RepID=UPI0015BFFF51|nr:hypothetical protein [Paenarthrobacter nitroguajacolicus]NWL35267.1 hypothetical protein [Paenarthrobacter nitroguajacolicus]